MALLRMTGFEAGHSGEISGTLATGFSIVNTPLPTNGGGRVLKNDGTGTGNTQIWTNLQSSPAIPSGSPTGAWFTTRFRIDSATAPSAWNYWGLFNFFDASGSFVYMGGCNIGQAPVGWNGGADAGKFTLYWSNNDADRINTFCPQITSGNWVELKLFVSPTAVRIWVNGVMYEYTGSGVYSSTASSQMAQMAMGYGSVSDATRPHYHDDYCAFDSDPAGVPFIIARQFASNGTTTAWTAVGGANKFTNVSETPFGATNAISSATASQIQDFNPNSFSATETGKGTGVITSGTHSILGAKMSLVAKTSATTSSGNLLKMRWRNSSAVVTTWQLSNLTTADRYHDLNGGANGVNSGAITAVNGAGIFVPASVTDLNGSQFGVDHDAGTRTKTVEDIWVHVAFIKTPKLVTADAGSYAMTGQVAGVKKGRRIGADVGSYSMSGQTANVTKVTPPKSILANAGSYAITGSDAQVDHGWKVGALASSYSITGQVALVKVGKRIAALSSSYTMTGSVAGIVRGLKVPAGAGTYSMSGSVAGVLQARKIIASAGSYSISGQVAGVKVGKRVAALAGSYSMSGPVAGVMHGYKLPAAAGSYAITGTDATLIKQVAKNIVASPGTYAMSGQVAIVRKAYTEAAGAGSYAISGQAAGVKVGRRVSAAPGSYQLTGTSAGIRRGLAALANAGTYQLTGQAAAVLKTRAITADGSSYTLTGQPALTIRSRIIAADPGSYLISGADAGLTRAGKGTAPFMVGSGGEMPAVHRQRDTRWDGVREAREEARRLFDKVPATPAKARKKAAVRASEAVAKVAKAVKPTRATELAFDPALDRLLELQAYLQGLIDQEEAIRAAQAREAAEMWAMIERELAAEQAREEELMVIFSLAL